MHILIVIVVFILVIFI